MPARERPTDRAALANLTSTACHLKLLAWQAVKPAATPCHGWSYVLRGAQLASLTGDWAPVRYCRPLPSFAGRDWSSKLHFYSLPPQTATVASCEDGRNTLPRFGLRPRRRT